MYVYIIAKEVADLFIVSDPCEIGDANNDTNNNKTIVKNPINIQNQKLVKQYQKICDRYIYIYICFYVYTYIYIYSICVYILCIACYYYVKPE